jgi:hypothetical protein
MRYALAAAALAALAALPAALMAPADAAAPKRIEFHSRAAVMQWMDGYRHTPEPERLPAAVRALSEAGALREPESAGFYLGFAAGVLARNPRRAERLINAMLPLPAADQWFVVRALAYSGLRSRQSILARTALRLPARRAMIDAYLADTLPTLQALEPEREPGFLDKLKMQFGKKMPAGTLSYANNPELLDTQWGFYFATGGYRPVWRIITLLRWSKERDSLARLTAGSAAKLTLANNAARYPDLLTMLKEMAPYQDEETAPILAEVIRAAETGQTAQVRKVQLAAIEEIKRKGPGAQRDMKLWGYVGQGAIALGCIAAASVSLTALGLPCVIGGAVSSAAINYLAAQ